MPLCKEEKTNGKNQSPNNGWKKQIMELINNMNIERDPGIFEAKIKKN